MKKIPSILLILTLAFPPGVLATEKPASIEALRHGQGSIHCTVFSINEHEHLWMTAHHCVVNHDETSKNPYGDNQINGESVTIYKDFPDMDVAIVRTERQSAPALKLAGRAPSIGDSVSVTGHGLGWESLTTFAGVVVLPSFMSEDGQFFSIFDMTVFPGHSGSPVFNAKGEVVSVCQIRFTFGRGSGGAAWIDLQRETKTYWR